MSDDEPAEVADPANVSFDDPSVTVSLQLSSVLGRFPFPPSSMRTTELKALRMKFCSKRIAVVSPVRHDRDRTVFGAFEFGEDWRRNFDLSRVVQDDFGFVENCFVVANE